MRILGIETSCDETAAAVVEDGHIVLSDVVVSQIDIHKRFGGTVPEIASRSHLETLLPVVEEALESASLRFTDVDAIAVTHRPGLIGALLVGVASAKTLALALDRPLIGIHHIAAHIYAGWMQSPTRPQAPFVSLVVSGGHTTLFRMDDPFTAVEIGSTIDDAVGEAFDKVAAVLKLGYPGGPIVDKMAQGGDPKRFPFKSPLLKKDGLDFTLSGIKTAVLYLVNGMNVRKEALPLTEANVKDVCASFQHQVVEALVRGTMNAVAACGASAVVVGGGCAANSQLRERFTQECERRGLGLHLPSRRLSTDNAVMIAGLAFHKVQREGADDLSLDAVAS